MQNHNDDAIKTSDTVLRKIYFSLYLKGLCVRGSWRPNRTATYWPQLLWTSAFLSRSPGLFNRGPGAQSLWALVFSTASYLRLVWSPTDWISCALSYIIVQRPPSSCGRHNFALIQPVRSQGYNPDIPRPDAPVIYTGAFPILTARPGRRSICNTNWKHLNSIPSFLLFPLAPEDTELKDRLCLSREMPKLQTNFSFKNFWPI